MNKMSKIAFLTFFILLLVASVAFGSEGIKEFASPLKKILDTLQGPLAQIIMIFMLVLSAIGYYFSRGEDLNGILKTLIGVVFMMTLIAFATSIVTQLFPGVSGALI